MRGTCPETYNCKTKPWELHTTPSQPTHGFPPGTHVGNALATPHGSAIFINASPATIPVPHFQSERTKIHSKPCKNTHSIAEHIGNWCTYLQDSLWRGTRDRMTPQKSTSPLPTMSLMLDLFHPPTPQLFINGTISALDVDTKCP